MGILKSFGKIAGSVAGAVIGAPISVVGEIVKSDFLQEVGEGVYRVSGRTGELLGNVADGAVETVVGTVKSDRQMQSKGVEKMCDSGKTYAGNLFKGVTNMAENGIDAIDGAIKGDKDKVFRAGKSIVKAAAVGALAVGVIDVVDGLDGLDSFDGVGGADVYADVPVDVDYIENPNEHYVTPHERTLPDGRTIWVDGDGDTSVDRDTGWYQSNPDYRV